MIDTSAPETSITAQPANLSNTASPAFTFSSSEAGSSFECRLDNGTFSTCTSPQSYSSLAEGSHTLQVRATDPAGNQDTTPASYSWVIDTASPTGSITAPADGARLRASVALTSDSDDTGGSGVGSVLFERSLAGLGSWTTIDSDALAPYSVNLDTTELTDGADYELRAITTDLAGNTFTSATVTVTSDNAPPNTTITAQPADPSNTASPSFSFAANEGGSSFECRLDNGTFSACASPQSYSGLSEGSRTFQVRATDAVGNQDATPASYSWTIDTTAPDTTLTAQPADPTSATAASFSFTSSESGSSFQCRLDSAPFNACTSPRDYTALTAGSHAFQVRAIDPAGNTDPTPATFTWNIDVTAPETSIIVTPDDSTSMTSAQLSFGSSEPGSSFACRLDGAPFSACTSPIDYSGLAEGSHTFDVRATDPAGNTDPTPASFTWAIDVTAPESSILSQPNNPTGSTIAVFSFASSEPDSSFECRLDEQAFETCASPKAYLGLSEGSHTFEVRATDGVGNTDATAASFSWTIDLTAPETSITARPADLTATSAASFSFDSSKPGSSFECRLDGAPFAACVSPKDYTGLGDGPHSFEVRARDAAGNADETPAVAAWTIDTTAPDTGIAARPADPTTATGAAFSFTSSEGNSSFECRLDNDSFAACTSPKDYTSLADGQHSFAVRARDQAGNTDPTPATFTWTIDTTAPETAITAAQSQLTNSTDALFHFEATEAGSSFQCRLDNDSFTACTSPKDYTSLADGQHTFQVRARDAAGNQDPTAASFTWTVDTTAPDTTFTTSPAALTNSAAATFAFAASEPGSSFACRLNGESFTPCTSPAVYTGLADGPQTFEVRARDAAGNEDPTPAVAAWTVDTTAPPVPAALAASPAGPANDNAPSIRGTAEAGSTVRLYETADCTGIPATSGSAAAFATGLPLSVPDDSTTSFRATATDAAGNVSGCSTAVTYVEDSLAPVSAVGALSPFQDSTSFGVSYTSSEAGSPAHEVELWVKGPADAAYAKALTDVTPSSPSFDYTASQGPGAYRFYTRARDVAGNLEAAPAVEDAATTVDLSAPTAPTPVLSESEPDEHVSGTNLFYNPSAGNSGVFSVSADPSTRVGRRVRCVPGDCGAPRRRR